MWNKNKVKSCFHKRYNLGKYSNKFYISYINFQELRLLKTSYKFVAGIEFWRNITLVTSFASYINFVFEEKIPCFQIKTNTNKLLFKLFLVRPFCISIFTFFIKSGASDFCLFCITNLNIKKIFDKSLNAALLRC